MRYPLSCSTPLAFLLRGMLTLAVPSWFTTTTSGIVLLGSIVALEAFPVSSSNGVPGAKPVATVMLSWPLSNRLLSRTSALFSRSYASSSFVLAAGVRSL